MTPDEVLQGVTSDQVVDLVSRLVAVASESGNESGVVSVARDALWDLGLESEIWSRRDESPNLVATIGSGHPVVALNGHLDTVPVSDPSAWETDPLMATVRGDRLYGLGALDMKGACAVMMLAAAQINRYAQRLTGTLQLQLVSDEEASGYLGTDYLIELATAGEIARPDMVLNGEYTGLKLMNAERGTFKFHVRFRGRPTHTATARVDGVNPIAHAARAVLALEKSLPRYHPEVGYGVRSVNMIHAGTHQSQVPNDCVLLVDRRLLPGETMETGLAEAAQEIQEALRDCPDAEYELTAARDEHGRLRYTGPSLTPWTSQVVQSVARAHQAVTGSPAEPFVDWFGATDGRLFRHAGIETVSYGPGGKSAHGSNEYVEISSLNTQLWTYVTALVTLLGGQSIISG